MARTTELDTVNIHEDGTLSGWSNEPEKAAEFFSLLRPTWHVNNSGSCYFVFDENDRTVAVFYKIPETEKR